MLVLFVPLLMVFNADLRNAVKRFYRQVRAKPLHFAAKTPLRHYALFSFLLWRAYSALRPLSVVSYSVAPQFFCITIRFHRQGSQNFVNINAVALSFPKFF